MGSTALALTLAASLAVSFSSAASAQEKDTLVIARSMDVNALDPARAFCDTCQIVLTSIYDPLTTLAPDNKTIVPRLAKSWEVNDNQTVFTFHIDPAAVFADGSPVEGKDVKWSFERLKNMKGNPSFFMDGVKSIEVTDPRTVVITLDASNSEFLNKLSAGFTGVINSDVAIAQGATADADADKTDKAEAWFLTHSAGSGPFALSAYRPDDELRLTRNEAYWGKKPAFSEVVFRQTKDSVAQAQMLESGAADIAMQIDMDTAGSLASPQVKTEIIPSYNFLYIALGAGAKSNTVPLTPDVRKAIALAIDYEGMIDFTVGGKGKKQSTAIPNGFSGTEGLPERKENLAEAKELLKKAGVPDGFEIEAVYPNDNIYGVDINLMMQKVQQDLARIGVKVSLKPSTYPVWRTQVNGEGIPLTAVYYAPDYYGTGQYADYFAMMPGTSWSKRAGAANNPAIINPKEAPLLAKALASAGADQEKAFHELALEMMADNIIIPMVSPDLVLAHRADIEGVRYSACCNLPVAEISRKK
ncbi:ABC transporter substrate-binding protein [Ancylobacter sp. Lp-2]|uniref:ABC transporter substrate-binding protein n=1 Tax=Ancylobacter sp. Lp-2 TaxID=2881339 RepID=UPI001E5E0336|nr:ABC transporter substrate-binding protein [Ancylobacter sp. Lp-2]MCB4768813.1 ABC transporter substrate-binding protein [Ancylobacter sp. Lp-2]